MQKNQSGSVKLCNPFQYVLKGVYIHCEDDNIDAYYYISTFNSRFGIHTDSELHLYIAPCIGCTGIAEGLGGGNSSMNIDFLTGGNLNHEFGHLMNLKHSWSPDGFGDTPQLSFDLDRNCDGDLFDEKETDQQCWNKINSTDPINAETDQIGANLSGKRYYNGVNDCSESDPCPASPCCLDQWINNNTMAYNADQNSFTYLQIREMLINLNNYKCNYINAIKTDRSCAPPSAFISDPLPGFVNTNPCKTCFDLSASFNEEKYKIKIYKIVNGNEQLVQDRPWITGQAGKICFTNGSNLVSSGSQLLKPNTTYRFELIVGRINTSCLDQNSVSKTFTTSDCNTDEAEEANSGFTNMSVSPNPGIDDIQINFNASLGEDYSIFAIKQSNGQIFELIHSYIPSVNGINTVEIVTSNLDSGSYILFSIGSLQNYYCNWIKL